MGKTKELLSRIRAAVADGRMTVDNIPLEDIRQCVRDEIEVHRSTFFEEQYNAVLADYERLCENLEGQPMQREQLLLWLDALILCVDMIATSLHALANQDYWAYMHRDELDNPEVSELVDTIGKRQRIDLINYDFTAEYDTLPVEVLTDAEGWSYVPYKGRKMYFPVGWSVEKITAYYRTLLMEQDTRSPHCYRMEDYEVAAGDVVVDAGAAEGIFALDALETASQIYLIEADRNWVEALHRTFREEDKVEVIYGFLGNVMEGNQVTIDGLFGDREINYIKMDIEGYEKPALEGARKVLSGANNLRCAICTYHCKEDEAWTRLYLQGFGFRTTTSKGFMCPDWTVEAYLEAQLRRGILFGNKRINGESANAPTEITSGDYTYDALIMVTPKDYLRLQNHYERLVAYLPVRKLLFVGSSEVGELVAASGLGDRVGFVDEDSILPFAKVHTVMKEALAGVVAGELPRGITGWYYQQFLKMQYARICEDAYYMVWDGDTVPCGAFSMFKDDTDIPYLDLKTEYHEEYFRTLEKLLPGMHKCIEKSFIAEHMLMKTDIMKSLIGDMEANGQIPGEQFWEKIIWAVGADKLQDNSFSEFETYGTYVAFKYPGVYRLRNWHSFRYGGVFFDPLRIDEQDFAWLHKDFFAISFEKGDYVREDHANLFDNKAYQAKLSARKMLEIAQEEFGEGSYRELWD